MGAVAMAAGAGHGRFIAAACVNIVVAANAGGAFSPFGDVTTLMVWQKGVVAFEQFLVLFFPSLVTWLIPAALMSLTVSRNRPAVATDTIPIKRGGFVVMALFLGTILSTILLHHFLHLPPFLGMMTGLGVLKLYGFFIRRAGAAQLLPNPGVGRRGIQPPQSLQTRCQALRYLYQHKACGMGYFDVLLRGDPGVGGLGALGYLALVSDFLYADLGPTAANILIGVLSAVVDNIPLMFAVLSINPDMSVGQWLLIHAHDRGRRVAPVHRLGRRCGAHGAGPRVLYVLFPPQMDLGHRPRIRGRHLDHFSLNAALL